MLSQEQVLEFCNKIRKAGGADVLPSLLPGIPMNSNGCLIANNLNFDCSIGPSGISNDFGNWVMTIEGDRHIEISNKISEELNMPIACREDSDFSQSTTLKLPYELGEIAYQFDKTWETIDNYNKQAWIRDEDRKEAINKYIESLESPWLLELTTTS